MLYIQEQFQRDLTFALKNQLNKDLSEKQKELNYKELELIRYIISQFNRVSKFVTNEQAIDILKKIRKGSIEINNTFEVEFIDKYLPKSLSEEELSTLISNYITEGSNNIGSIMGKLKQSGLTYDGKLASKVALTLLK